MLESEFTVQMEGALSTLQNIIDIPIGVNSYVLIDLL